MADLLFPIALMYFVCILYAKRRLLWRFSLITQFIVGWWIIELAWLNAGISVVTLVMAVGDLGDWSFATVIGFSLTAYNAVQLWEIHQNGQQSENECKKALINGLGENYLDEILPERSVLLPPSSAAASWLRPFHFSTADMDVYPNLAYGSFERNNLSIFKSKLGNDKPRPVMLQIHGGGWTLGHSEYQGLPLRNKLVEAGWIFISINYRLSPADKFPAHLIDCKQALHWIKQNIGKYGGNPNFVMTTGGSAGGHLCSLLALTENQHKEVLQPGFECIDTSVQGCVPLYGVYDFVDRCRHRTDIPLTGFLERYVMPHKHTDGDDLWELASPVAQVHEDCPPFMVMHGQLDTLSFVEDAQYFVKTLGEVTSKPLVYAELEQAQHAFDIFHSPRSVHSIAAIHAFCEHTYSQYLSGDFIAAKD